VNHWLTDRLTGCCINAETDLSFEQTAVVQVHVAQLLTPMKQPPQTMHAHTDRHATHILCHNQRDKAMAHCRLCPDRSTRTQPIRHSRGVRLRTTTQRRHLLQRYWTPTNGPLCANLMSSIKPEVHHASQCHQRRTKSRRHAQKLVKIGRVVLEICLRTDRQTADENTERAIAGRSYEREVEMMNVVHGVHAAVWVYMPP